LAHLTFHFAGQLGLIAECRPAVHGRNRRYGLPLLFALTLDVEHGEGGVAVARLLVNLLKQSVNLLEALRDDRHMIDELALDDATGQVRETGHHERHKRIVAKSPEREKWIEMG